MTKTSIPRRKPVVAASREEHVAQMRAAADKHLTDRSQAERHAWADAKVDEYLRKGILAIQPVRP